MTDRDPAPGEEAALRRLLRDVRHDGPVPPEVAARTEATLAGLGAGSAGAAGRGGQVGRGAPDHHRRRRAATALLVAAVSVVVVGIGVGQVVRPAGQQESSSAGSSAGSAARDTPPDRAAERGAREAPAEPEALSEQADELDSAARSGGAGLSVERLALVDDPPAVRETRFPRDVRRVRALQQAERGERPSSVTAGGVAPVPRDPAPGFTCARADWGPGRAVAVRYEEAPAVLVLRPATRATQVADLVECGSGAVVRSVTLPR